jgi:translation initiation factor 3 subunit M
MVVSSALVNVSDDAEIRLVALLAEAAPSDLISPTFAQDCQASMDAGQAGPLLTTILKEKGAVAALLVLEPKDDAVAAVSLLSALMEREKRPIQDLVTALVAAELPNTATRKITLLSVLYNMRSDAKEKTLLLQQMFQLAGDSCPRLLEEDQPLGSMLTGRPSPKIVGMMDAWNVTDRRELYKTIVNVTSDERKQRFLLLLIESYPDAIDAAKEAAIGAIRDPVALFVQQRTMLSLPAIQGLQKDNATLYALLKVFQEGKLSDYQAFLQAQGGEDKVITPFGLTSEACMRNMRILSLCSLASEYEEIPYMKVAETLQLPSDSEVESWVIAAMSSGLLQAKMDQLQNMVMVERCVVRRFDVEQWKVLQRRLEDWKQNVGGVLQGLKDAQTV